MYGGAAGGGKSDALLMAAAQYVDVPGYAALLLRRSFADLNQPDSLIPRSKGWWADRVTWNPQAHRWTFPSGATISFGYLERDDDVYQYQSAAYQLIGVDELTQHTEFRYRYMFSRLRKSVGVPIPLRMRSGTNPGGVGHEWVRKRFLKERDPERVFVPSRLEDNPHLDREDYLRSLAALDPITRAQLLAGDWDAYEGGRFKREWFREYTAGWDKDGRAFYRLPGRARPVYLDECQVFAICDPAATEKEHSDYTAIMVVAVTPDRDLLVLHVVRRQVRVDEIVPLLAAVCADWRPQFIGIEATGFSWAVIFEARRHKGIPAVMGLEPEGKGKLVRATPAIVRTEAGQVFLPESALWREDFEAELVQFTGDDKQDAHDDQVDAFAYAVQQMDRAAPVAMQAIDARGRKLMVQSAPGAATAAQRRGLFGVR